MIAFADFVGSLPRSWNGSSTTKIYRGSGVTANTTPVAPTGLTAAVISGATVGFAWNSASDFETPVVTELLQATKSERNALMDCVEHFQNKVWTKAPTTEADRLAGLLDPSPKAARLFTLNQLYDRARERSSKTSELFDYLGIPISEYPLDS